MESIREVYRIGMGPSSSHSMGPRRAAQRFLEKHPNNRRFRVTLYGSLAATGLGHLTDRAILEVLGKERTELLWKPEVTTRHPFAWNLSTSDHVPFALAEWRRRTLGGQLQAGTAGPCGGVRTGPPSTAAQGICALPKISNKL